MALSRFKKGDKKPEKSGRKKGVQNELTKQMKTVKEMVLQTAITLNSSPQTSLLKFAKDDPKTFWTIAAKLIPTELTGFEGKDLFQTPPQIIIIEDNNKK